MKSKYLIIGASAAGIGAMRTLARLDSHNLITVIANQKEIPYNTCLLADYCAGTTKRESLSLMSGAQPPNIHLRLATHVSKLMASERQLICTDGSIFQYDRLLIATGTSASIPKFPGIEGTFGIFTFHSLADIDALNSYIGKHSPQQAIVVGAGLSGLEAADALQVRGINVTILEQADRLLPTFIDYEESIFLERCAKQAGITVRLAAQVRRIERNRAGYIQALRLADGSCIETDCMLITTGAKPNLDLAKSGGIAHTNEGIVVDEYMKTSDDAIYAAGDIVLITDRTTGNRIRSSTWPDAMAQGMVAAHSMAGMPKQYHGTLPSIGSSFFGVTFAVFADYTAAKKGSIINVVVDEFASEAHIYNAQGVLHGVRYIGKKAQSISDLKRKISSALS